MKRLPLKTNSTLASLAIGCMLLSAGASPASASILIDPMDSIGAWEVGGGPNATNLSLTVDTSDKVEGSGSFKVVSTFQQVGGAYTDLYLSLGTPLDFSSDTFSVAFQTSDISTYVLWRLGTVEGPVYEATFVPTSVNTWQTISFIVSDFTATPANLANVNLIQFRIIGDALSSYPSTVTTHFDNLQIIPEPSAAVLLLGGLCFVCLAVRYRRSFAK